MSASWEINCNVSQLAPHPIKVSQCIFKCTYKQVKKKKIEWINELIN